MTQSNSHCEIGYNASGLSKMATGTIIEITPEGEEATKKYLELMRAVADRFLGSNGAAGSTIGQ